MKDLTRSILATAALTLAGLGIIGTRYLSERTSVDSPRPTPRPTYDNMTKLILQDCDFNRDGTLDEGELKYLMKHHKIVSRKD